MDLIIADPPYGKVVKEDWDQNIEDYATFTFQWLSKCRELMKPHASIYVWCTLKKDNSSLLHVVEVLKELFVFQDMVVWGKQRAYGNKRGWLHTREEMLWATKTDKYVWNKEHQYSTVKYHDSWVKRLGKEDNPYKRCTNVWTDIEEVTIEQARKSGSRGKRIVLHPTQKPTKAHQRIILSHTQEGDTVLDPFAGSGTTAIACIQTNRKYILIEKEAEYVSTIFSRIAEETAKHG